MRSLVISISLYSCESWTMTAELEKRTQAFEMRFYQKVIEHFAQGPCYQWGDSPLENMVNSYNHVQETKLRWFVSRSSGLAKTILQGTVNGNRRKGRKKKRWKDNNKECTGMDFAGSTKAAEDRTRWKGVVAKSSVVSQWPYKVMG